jgi:hypothetical protein
VGGVGVIMETPDEDSGELDEKSDAGEAGGSASLGGINIGSEGRQRGAGGGCIAALLLPGVGNERE